MEKETTNNRSVYCYGKEFPFDHPKIYLEINSKLGYVICPYCSKCFELKHC